MNRVIHAYPEDDGAYHRREHVHVDVATAHQQWLPNDHHPHRDHGEERKSGRAEQEGHGDQQYQHRRDGGLGLGLVYPVVDVYRYRQPTGQQRVEHLRYPECLAGPSGAPAACRSGQVAVDGVAQDTGGFEIDVGLIDIDQGLGLASSLIGVHQHRPNLR